MSDEGKPAPERPVEKIIKDEGKVVTEKTYISKTDKEIRQLALDVLGGNVFGSWSLREHEKSMLGMVFMPMMMIDDIARKNLEKNEIVHFYGYLKDSFERSINGLPMFHSVHLMDGPDAIRLDAAMKILAEFVDKGED